MSPVCHCFADLFPMVVMTFLWLTPESSGIVFYGSILLFNSLVWTHILEDNCYRETLSQKTKPNQTKTKQEKIVVPGLTCGLELLFYPLASFYLALTLAPLSFSSLIHGCQFSTSFRHYFQFPLRNSLCLSNWLNETLTNKSNPLILWTWSLEKLNGWTVTSRLHLESFNSRPKYFSYISNYLSLLPFNTLNGKYVWEQVLKRRLLNRQCM